MLDEMSDGTRADAAPHLFRCTFCGSVIPWLLAPAELGLDPAATPAVGELYPFEGCFCGYGRFVLCEAMSGGSSTAPLERSVSATAGKVNAARYEVLPLDRVHPNPRQPRKFFDGEALRGLADSIRAVGLLEDILVRPDGDGYEIVLGERRWKAAQLAGVTTISAKVVELDDDEARSIAITENIHREDLTAVEEAFSFKAYIDAGGEITSVGRQFGGMEERVADRLRLLNGHHFVSYQQQRIDELTETVARLREQRQRSGPGRYEVCVVDEAGLLDALANGFEVAVTLADGRLALRRPLSR